MKPPSFDAILAALAVLSLTGGCTKKEPSATPAPETAPATRATTDTDDDAPAPTAAPPPAAAPPPVTPQPTAATEEAPAARAVGAATTPAVDAGVEGTSGNRAPKRGATATCGASGCSPDMKKGGK